MIDTDLFPRRTLVCDYFIPSILPAPSVAVAVAVAVAGSAAIVATCVFTSVITTPSGIIPAPSGIIAPGVATSVVGVLPGIHTPVGTAPVRAAEHKQPTRQKPQ